MAKFKNIHKRRSPKTGERVISPGEQLIKNVSRVLADKGIIVTGAADVSHGSVQEIILTGAANGMMADDGDIQPLGAAPIRGEHFVRIISRWFFRLRQWLREFFAASRYTHPKAWLLASQRESRL